MSHTLMRFLWLFWTSLTWLSAMLCTIGVLLPFWLRGDIQENLSLSKSSTFSSSPASVYDRQSLQFLTLSNGLIRSTTLFSDLGLYRRCVFPLYTSDGSVLIHRDCGNYPFKDLPHVTWKIAMILFGVACFILFLLSFVLFFLGFCMYILLEHVVCRSCQALQGIAGLMCLIGCLLYPIGWKNNLEVEQICGTGASPFTPGRCQVGWAYVLTCAGSTLAVLSTTLPLIMTNRFSSVTAVIESTRKKQKDPRHGEKHKSVMYQTLNMNDGLAIGNHQPSNNISCSALHASVFSQPYVFTDRRSISHPNALLADGALNCVTRQLSLGSNASSTRSSNRTTPLKTEQPTMALPPYHNVSYMKPYGNTGMVMMQNHTQSQTLPSSYQPQSIAAAARKIYPMTRFSAARSEQ